MILRKITKDILKYEALNAAIKRYRHLINNNLKLYSDRDTEFTKKVNNKLAKDFDLCTGWDKSITNDCPCCFAGKIIQSDSYYHECDACYIKDAIYENIIEGRQDRECMNSFYKAFHKLLGNEDYTPVLNDLLLIKKWIQGHDIKEYDHADRNKL